MKLPPTSLRVALPLAFGATSARGTVTDASARSLSTRSATALLSTLMVLLSFIPVAAADTPLGDELSQALAEFDRAQQQAADQPDVARPAFLAVAQRLEAIAAAVTNGALEYNIGNCYLRAGDIGRAVLHYLRAERLIPRDPLLADNLREAKSRCLTAVKPSRRTAWLHSLLFWHSETSARERAFAGAAAFLSFWALLTVRLFIFRRGLVVTAFLCGLVAAASGGSLATQSWLDRHAPHGVIVTLDVPAYKGPGPAYQRQFEQPLQPGVEFTLRERRGNWWRVELPDGNEGWIESAQAQLVVSHDPVLGVRN